MESKKECRKCIHWKRFSLASAVGECWNSKNTKKLKSMHTVPLLTPENAECGHYKKTEYSLPRITGQERKIK